MCHARPVVGFFTESLTLRVLTLNSTLFLYSFRCASLYAYGQVVDMDNCVVIM
jgi:hypothetical protein